MDSIKRAEIIVGALLLMFTLVGRSVSAQSDFAGEWLDLGHEDVEVDPSQPAAGPDLSVSLLQMR